MMKTITLALTLLASFGASAQYSQRWFGSMSTPSKKHSFYDGLCTVVNYTGADTSFFCAAAGMAKLEMTDSAGLTKYDELRFTRINSKGSSVFINKGYAFKSDTSLTDRWFNSTGRGIAEMNTADHKGGYMVVGSITSNSLTGATCSGGGDALISKILHSGLSGTRIHIDFKNGNDILYSITASKADSARFYACGTSEFSNSSNLIAIKFDDKGKVYWAKSYKLNIIGGASQTKCTGYSICESATGGEILIAGKINDPHNATGDDALIAKLNSANGDFISAIAYNYSGDDSYRVIKTLTSGEYLIGGTVGINGVASSMFMGRAAITGLVTIHKTLQSVLSPGGATATSCFDAVERYSSGGPNEFYFTGARSAGATGSDAIVVKTDLSCNPAALYPYSGLATDEAIAIDFSEATSYSAGLRLFSNISDATAPGKTDAYISRLYFNGVTCTNYCPDDSFTLATPLYTPLTVTEDTTYTRYKKGKLSVITQDYNSAYLCNQASISCGSNAREFIRDNKDNFNEGSISIFPNPAGNFIRLSASNLPDNTGIIRIHDMQGRLVSEMTFYSANYGDESVLDISSLEPGSYLLTYTGDLFHHTIKFVKQH